MTEVDDRWLDVVGEAVDEPDAEAQRALWEQAVELADGPLRRALALGQLGVLDVKAGAVAEGVRRFEEARRLAPGAAFVYLAPGEALLDAGAADSAEAWLRRGARELLEDDPDEQLDELLEIWERALAASGRDGGELHEQAAQAAVDALRENVIATGQRITLPWYPPDLWQDALASGELPDSLRAETHTEYTRRVEEMARGLAADGVRVAAIRPIGLRDETVGELAPWPPGRNDACWCGSGRKYKRCCGA